MAWLALLLSASAANAAGRLPCLALTELGCADRADAGVGPRLFSQERARAEFAWSGGGYYTYTYHVPNRKKFRFSLEVGARYLTHYNQQRVISTPPATLQGEGQLLFWFKSTAALYLVFGKSLALNDSTLYGAGMRLPFLSFSSGSGAVSGITLGLVGDVVNLVYPAPTSPDVYAATNFTYRYGMNLTLNLGETGMYADFTGMICYVGNNFFIAPLFGLGYNF